MSTTTCPTDVADPINSRILAVSEDCIKGFQTDPLGDIARQSGVPLEKLDVAFEFLLKEDPFSGHVVIRSTDPQNAGARFRLWTTLKVPQGFSIDRHCRFLEWRIGATAFRIMPAKKVFALGVGHV